jgi:FKBP-type peptidyl-prolyl cis-trans isomerase (trigger factor)
MAAKKKTKQNEVIAKSDDGTIQITYTIPFAKIKKSREEAAAELAKDIEIPGFRKGKAPVSKVLESIPENTMLEKSLSNLLPKMFADTIKENDIKPATYPKFEIVSRKENEDWQIRATTAEVPDIKLGKYEEKVKGALRSGGLWKPGDDKKKEPSRAEKEQVVMKTLLESIKFKIPEVFIESEVNSRLSKLLDQIEKLGLDLESYLSSINKTSEEVRAEYEKQAHDAVALDLILSKIVNEKSVKVEKEEIEAALGASGADPNLQTELNTPERRRLVESILQKRKVLNDLASL